MDNTIITVDKLEKKYGSSTAVDKISFEIERGSLVSILGPNGAGKTTTLECMEGLKTPTGGTVSINGGGEHSIGIQLQSSALPGNLTVIELMKLFCAYRRIQPRLELLERFGLNDKLKTRFCSLSTGQKRRLGLVLSVIHNPEVLFLDEPTAGLDVESRLELHGIIEELKYAGTTILLATHDMAEAENLSDRIIILLNGKIAADGSPAEITSAGDSLSKISVKTRDNTVKTSLSLIPAAGRLPYKR